MYRKDIYYKYDAWRKEKYNSAKWKSFKHNNIIELTTRLFEIYFELLTKRSKDNYIQKIINNIDDNYKNINNRITDIIHKI